MASPSRPKSASSNPATTRCATAPTRAPPAAPSETRAAVRQERTRASAAARPQPTPAAPAPATSAPTRASAPRSDGAGLPPSTAIARPPSRPASAPAAAPPADAAAHRDPARRDARLRRRPTRAAQAAGPAGGARSGTLPAPATSHRLSRRWAHARAWPGARSRRRRASAVSSACSSSAASPPHLVVRVRGRGAGRARRPGGRSRRRVGAGSTAGPPAVGSRRLTVVRFLGDRAHELVAVPGDGPDEDALAVLAERAPQRPHRLGEGAVGDHHVRPHAIEDLLPVQGHRALLDEQQQQVEVARDERHLPPRPEERAAGGRERELREAVARRGHPPPAQPSFGGRSVIGPIHSSIRSMSWWSW